MSVARCPIAFRTVRFSYKDFENTFYMSAIRRLHHKFRNNFLNQQKIP